MRYLLALFLLLVAAPAFADSEFREGSDWVRITPKPCTNDKVLAFLEQAGENALDYHAASAEVAGAPFAGCWKPAYDKRVIMLRYDDNDQGMIPFGDMKPVKET